MNIWYITSTPSKLRKQLLIKSFHNSKQPNNGTSSIVYMSQITLIGYICIQKGKLRSSFSRISNRALVRLQLLLPDIQKSWFFYRLRRINNLFKTMLSRRTISKHSALMPYLLKALSKWRKKWLKDNSKNFLKLWENNCMSQWLKIWKDYSSGAVIFNL